VSTNPQERPGVKRAKAAAKRRMEDVPLPGTESLIPDNPPVNHFLLITVKRRDLLKAKRDFDAAIWKAHKGGMTHKLIGQAADITEASVRDFLKRIRRQKEEQRRELER
jgi:hypothetical protein